MVRWLLDEIVKVQKVADQCEPNSIALHTANTIQATLKDVLRKYRQIRRKPNKHPKKDPQNDTLF